MPNIRLLIVPNSSYYRFSLLKTVMRLGQAGSVWGISVWRQLLRKKPFHEALCEVGKVIYHSGRIRPSLLLGAVLNKGPNIQGLLFLPI